MFALCLLGSLGQATPASAYSFTLNIFQFPICIPTHAGSFCSLRMDSTNFNPAIPAPVTVRMQLTVAPAFIATSAGGSASWSCVIVGGGIGARCTYVGPKPIPAGFHFPSITVRARAKPITTPMVNAQVCGQIQAFSGNNPLPSPATHCTTVTIVP
jgi:hypothetical protein